MEEKNLETKIDGAETTTQIEETNVPQNETHDSKPVVEEKKPNDKKQEKQEKVDDVKDEETKIKEAIQKRLKEKIRESGFWTEEQLSKASNIEESQTKMAADYIYDMGKDRLGKEKGKDEESHSKKYYDKLKKKCMDITENEAQVNPNFDIDAAIEKEEEIKKKLEAGEITPEEALKAYSEPIPELGGGMLSSLQKYGVKTYEDIYKEMTAKEQANDKSKSFRESLAKDAPTLEEQAENSRAFQEKVASIDNDRKAKTSDELSK